MRGLFSCLVILLSLGLVGTAFGQNPGDVNCSPANLLLVVDTSGSMSSAGKLDGLKKAAAEVVNSFKTKLRMGLIRFSGGKAELLVPIGPAHAAKPDTEGHAQKLLAAIQGLQATGDTPMTQALELAVNTYTNEIPGDPLHKDPDPQTKRRNFVLLVTDGEPTDATTTYNPLMFIKKLRKLLIGTKEYDIFTFVVGLGSGNDIRTFELSQYAIAGGTQNFLHALVAADLAPFFTKISNTATTEVCNGRDDDCSGTIDEDLERDCKNNCGTGKEKCHKGKWSQCSAPPPGEEICDGKDNNCNGEVDEGLRRPCSSPCGTGTQSCVQGDWSTCDAPRPEPEICDGLDNDCDGQVDNGNLCTGGKCVIGAAGKVQCEIKCTDECPNGYICDRDSQRCVERPCFRKKCPIGSICEESATGVATCKDPCASVTCPAGLTCGESGTCIDCYKEACPPGKTCIQGKCQIDECKSGQGCPTGQGCRDGKCFDVCEGIKCAADEWCEKGKCVKNPCHNKQCAGGETCTDGKCVKNKCIEKNAIPCGPGQLCDPVTGSCDDDPCNRTQCPGGLKCFRGQCGVAPPAPTGQEGTFCQKDGDCQQGLVCKSGYCIAISTQGGSGACSCAMTSEERNWYNPVLALLVLWGFLLLLRIRRRTA